MPSLTHALGDKNDPLRVWFDRTFPNLRPISQRFKEEAGPLLIDGEAKQATFLGDAFDLMVKFTLDPSHYPDVAVSAFAGKEHAEIERVIALAQHSAQSQELDSLSVACWALAHTTQNGRSVYKSEELAALREKNSFHSEALLGLIPVDRGRELHELHELAQEQLFPVIGRTQLNLGPVLAASRRLPADADLIADGVLYEIKVMLGRKNSAGVRYSVFEPEDIRQTFCYVLFDTPDEFCLNEMVLYSARYGQLYRMPLNETFAEAAGKPVDLAVLRAQVWQILGG